MAHLDKIRLCARLANFAYEAGNPSMRDSTDRLRSLPRQLPDSLSSCFQGHQVINFKEFHTTSWIHSFEHQHKYFRSNAYLLHLRKEKEVDTIVVGLRGTFNYSSPTGANFVENVPVVTGSRQPCFSRFVNWIFDKLAPSNYGLSDFYYDATVIRVPYRKGSLWKWYAYWGTLILERTRRAPSFFSAPRRVAADWISRPSGESLTQRQDGHVHLGFWSLWASPEGFAGYTRQGVLPGNPDDYRLLQHCREAIDQAQSENRHTEILVVGHSLGGAVSCFAALDIAEELKGRNNIILSHVTFGAPPVGTADFARYFAREMAPHQSLAIFHHRDAVPQCFALASTIWPWKWLGWWSDWSRVGAQMPISKLYTGAHNADKSMKFIDKVKFAFIALGTATFLISSNLLCIIAGGLWYLRHRTYFREKENPRTDWRYTEGEQDRLIVKEVRLEYHSLQRYIELLGDPDVFTVSQHGAVNAPAASVEQQHQ